MNVFRLTLFTAGVTIFLIVRFFAVSGTPASGNEPLPPAIPNAEPAEAPNDPHPFLQISSDLVLAWVP